MFARRCETLAGKDASAGERTAAALRVLREFVALVRRLTYSTAHLRAISHAALSHMQPAPAAPSEGAASGHRVLDARFVTALGVGGDEVDYTSADTSALARSVVTELGLLCPDASIGGEVRPRGPAFPLLKEVQVTSESTQGAWHTRVP